jgi:signal transduction histidine kinase
VEVNAVNPYVRGLLSLATLALIALYGWTLQPGPLTWGALVVMALLYQVMILARQDWWTRGRFVAVVCLLIALALVVSLSDGGDPYASVLLIPLLLLLAKEQEEYRRLAMWLAVVTLVTMAGLSRLAPFAFTLLAGALTLYMCIRAINIYKSANRLSEWRLRALDEAHRELQRAHADLQEASVHSMRYAALAERTRLAREMHDGLGHHLTSLIVQLQALEIMLPSDPDRAAAAVPAMLDVTRKAMAEVRLAVSDWREDESKLGLAALQGLVSQTAAHAGFTISFQQDGYVSDWPVELSMALYRILQEALTNVMRHAAATAAAVEVRERDHDVTLTVADNGCYTADERLTPGFGLKGVMERCHALGGVCALVQTSPHGLTLQVTLPIHAASAPGADSVGTGGAQFSATVRA